MDKIIDGFYITKPLDNGYFCVDILRVEKRLKDIEKEGWQSPEIYYRYVLIPDFQEELIRRGRQPLSKEQMFPVVEKTFKKESIGGKYIDTPNLPPILTMLPPKNGYGIERTLKKWGMKDYDAWTLGKKSGHTISYPVVIRSEWNQQYFPDGIYQPTIYQLPYDDIDNWEINEKNSAYYKKYKFMERGLKSGEKLDLKEVLNPFNYTGKDRSTLIYVKGRKTPDIGYIMEKFGLSLKELDDKEYWKDKE